MMQLSVASCVALLASAGLMACSSATSPIVHNRQDAPADAAATSTATGTATTQAPAASTVVATSSGTGSATSSGVCIDVPPPPEGRPETCATWFEMGECDYEWMQKYCDVTCGRCSGISQAEMLATVPVAEVVTWPSVVPSGTSAVTPVGANAQTGWASRYWDCCKPHCAWADNTSAGYMRMCTMSNGPLNDPNAASSCEGGPAFVCWDMAPWAVSQNLAYGYAATPHGGSDCGRCYQLDFTGAGQHNANDRGSVAIAGKTMIVQATNTGGDVGGGQFDIMVPGGGVGIHDGCSRQWGTTELGAQYGGFVSECGTNKECVATMCLNTFSKSGMESLLAGCLFYVEWFEAANNPQLRYQQVPCPSELTAKSGLSG